MKSASRTLVKSQPELWELIDQPDRMQGLMSGLLGHATEVSVDERDPESRLRWKADGEEAWIRVQLAEKGWGTHVEVSASKAKESISLEGWLDAVLEELATPEKRPFSAGKTEKRVIETPVDDPEPEPEPEPSEPEPPVEAARQAPADPARESPGKKLRRFFGL